MITQRTHSIIFILILCCTALNARQKTFNITQFGAIPDAKTLNTQAIQKAIDTCATLGGGCVLIPKGTFLSGSFKLKSGVELHITEGGILLGSTQHKDYSKDIPEAWYGFILAHNQHDISITGKGIIDGQGQALSKDVIRLWLEGAFPDAIKYDEKLREKNRPNERFRPQIIIFQNCKNVKIEGITLKNSACWVQTYINCSDLSIKNIKVESMAYWNNDGIDIVDCRNVHISNCNINSADDAICLKSFDKKGGCENVLIENCTMRSSASALKLGTSSYGGFRKITARNLTVFDTYRSAIALECVDGGILKDINITHVKAQNTGNAIFIKLGKRLSFRPIGSIENIKISNIEVEIPNKKPDKGYLFEGPVDTLTYNLLPVSIVGLPNFYIKNVVLENINITYAGGGKPEIAHVSLDSLDKIPEQTAAYPEFQMFGELPAWAFYARHTEGVVFKNIKLVLKEKDYRPAFVLDDVKGLSFNKINIPSDGIIPPFALKNTELITFKRINSPKKDKTSLIFIVK
jgi:polygalacturonase